MDTSCKAAVVKTLCYKSIFKYPLSIFQLYNGLITDTKVTPESFKRAIKASAKNRHIKVIKNRLYYLPDTLPLSWTLRFKNTKKVLNDNAYVFGVLKGIPWIKMLAVTGSVACFNADDNDDIDIFIITDKGRVWLTRLFVVTLLKILNKYPNENNSTGKFCPNLYIDTSKLSWDPKKRNLFIAHEIITMFPIINRNNTYFNFIKNNDWIFDYYANFEIDLQNIVVKSKAQNKLVDYLENFVMKVQLDYMKRRQTKELTSNSLVHFIKNDCTQDVLKKYHDLIVKNLS